MAVANMGGTWKFIIYGGGTILGVPKVKKLPL